MRTTITSSRVLSLRPPIAGEGERAQFQDRLTLTLTTIFVLSILFWLLQLAGLALVSKGKVAQLFTHASAAVHMGTTLTALLVAGALRRGKLSATALGHVDAAATILICAGWSMMMFSDENRVPGAELVALLATSYTLATRAALLPSTPARSALIGILSMFPLLPLTRWLQSGSIPGDPFQMDRTFYTAIWACVGTACTTAISHVIYGLRLQVRKAMQLGQYLLEDKIGEGGMGVVYRARHALLRRPCAIKLLTGSAGTAAERFEREVQITAKLTHPNTVIVFDYGRTPDGAFYYAMEYIEGITLEELVIEHGAQPIARVVHLLLQVCGALEEAHRAGLVHRDIKPANMMLTERGGVRDVLKVLDFGLVKSAEQHTDPTVSSVNTVLGTPQYMSPEAIVDPAHVDGRTDLYALGATAYFLLTGERVFEGVNLVEVCSQHLHQPPVKPSEKRSEIPRALEDAVLACLAKKADDRPRDAATLADLLRACAVGEWTRADAEAWWATVASQSDVDRALGKSKRSGTTRASAYGKTVAVALDDRAAS